MDFIKAYKYMEEHGMHKGGAFGPNGSVCILGACSMLEEDLNFYRDTDVLSEVARELFPDRLGMQHSMSVNPVAQVNDHPDTTLDDMRVIAEKAQLRQEERV